MLFSYEKTSLFSVDSCQISDIADSREGQLHIQAGYSSHNCEDIIF
jgi:hypothetical protein